MLPVEPDVARIDVAVTVDVDEDGGVFESLVSEGLRFERNARNIGPDGDRNGRGVIRRADLNDDHEVRYTVRNRSSGQRHVHRSVFGSRQRRVECAAIDAVGQVDADRRLLLFGGRVMQRDFDVGEFDAFRQGAGYGTAGGVECDIARDFDRNVRRIGVISLRHSYFQGLRSVVGRRSCYRDVERAARRRSR